MTCPICKRRKPERYCPAKGEKICAVCCGTEREVTIACTPDCSFLLAAHRYENEHPRTIPADTPLLDVQFSSDIVHTNQPLLTGLAFAVAKFASAQSALTDPDALAAIQALAETTRTLSSGIHYEKPPEASAPRALYAELVQFFAEAKHQQVERPGFAPIKDSEVFALLVFLYRMGLYHSNGRPRSRRFLEFLRSQFSQSPELRREESRIIVP